MKKRFIFPLLLFLCLVLGGTPCGFISSAAETEQSVTTAACKNTFVTVNGRIYYYNSKGTMLKKTWKTIKKKRYYFYRDGHAAAGSSVIGKNIMLIPWVLSLPDLKPSIRSDTALLLPGRYSRQQDW